MLSLSSFRVASVNLLNYIEPPLASYEYDAIYTQPQWQQKQLWLQHFIEQQQPDIIGFQEVFSCDALKQQLQALGYPYFVVVQQPELIADYIYHKPVVALASRYEVSSCAALAADHGLLDAAGLSGLQFSRQPLRATVQLPGFGALDCCVVHLKSKRPQLEPAFLVENHQNPLLAAFGRWASTVQRGTEAQLLINALCSRRQQHRLPLVLMGDLNDTPSESSSLSILSQAGELWQKQASANAIDASGWNPVRLHDAYLLAKQHQLTPGARPATHYYGSKGSVLDYILLSDEFDSLHPACRADVLSYQTFDKHLVRPDYSTDAYSSDHAPVMVQLQLR
ncbi:endonuclease/exonuclease/phosphatase family protein [Alkalimonas amylolytica]|uniref:Endonuclease/Exonuclease/phosphatase family protein n=1 Tax=Alkalimonas amylolytica TaxID=152573 RepID=A0A1H3Z5V3_ALKAM|nr:endonuclease/exonuclease/phosphatase family protein [Alkalimonas amylolytica]SEA18751.1 Endonuclease/Exonuclease/phosphatase family protein [Alkalimonas amylolytica]